MITEEITLQTVLNDLHLKSLKTHTPEVLQRETADEYCSVREDSLKMPAHPENCRLLDRWKRFSLRRPALLARRIRAFRSRSDLIAGSAHCITQSSFP
jgi:hypothetical protein